ncbi:MAG: nucleoside triphosphate pyrophosphohydrolase [Coriobacteriia bacterium]|nr:nucleoside triphosphate pyrophosphohydrolase [Coriobacteriia bacterium]
MGSVSIVGLVEGRESLKSAAVLDRVRRAATVVVPSADAAALGELATAEVPVTTLGEIGVSADSPVEEIVDAMVALSREGDLVYLAPGYPLLREGIVSGLLARSGENVEVFPDASPLHVLLMALDIDLTADLDIVDVHSLRCAAVGRASHLIVTGVADGSLARSVAEQLAETYRPDHPVVVAGCLEGGGFDLGMYTVATLPEAELCSSSAIHVGPSHPVPPHGFEEFVRLIAVLRGPGGCPWDRAQDHMSLRQNMIEEAFEAVAAIEAGESTELAEELGDVLLQVVLHAQMGAEAGEFTIDDVIDGIAAKIRRRHPHIFGQAIAGSPAEVLKRWDEIKREEKAGGPTGVFGGIPHALPALMYAAKLSRRAVAVGFEWPTLDAVWEKVHEEIEELKATEPGSPQAADEIGDLLFTVVNLARKQGIDAETALRGTCEKFRTRFEAVERAAQARGVTLEEMGIDEMEKVWRSAKTEEEQR